jgi:nucleotide-binding universal stress UspA family protein
LQDFSARRRSWPAEDLAAAAAKVGVEAEVVEDFGTAAARGRHLARELEGVLVVTGSHYALAPARAALALCEDSPR